MSRPRSRTTGMHSEMVDPATLSPLLRHIAHGTAVTRADLARVTSLSRSTVTQRVDTLMNAGLVVEGGIAPSGGGRPGVLLNLNPNAGLILSADLGATHARLAVSDLTGHELGSLGEHRRNYPTLAHLLFVKVGTGIGCGIIASRRLYRGAVGAAGDIGHIRVPGSDTPCRCGNAGCLEAVAGGQALATRLNQKGHNTKTARDVAQLAAAGIAEARSEVRTAAQHIGEVP